MNCRVYWRISISIFYSEGMKEEGKLHTIDINEELKEMSSKYFKKANIDDKIVQHEKFLML